jgi:multicomponent Na+:H+ antiporter subunit G
MSALLDAATVLLVLVGLVCFLAGTVGVLRFPDALTRLHALTKADNLGLGFIALGLLLQAGSWLAATKIALVWLVMQIDSASVAQLVARVARREDGAA